MTQTTVPRPPVLPEPKRYADGTPYDRVQFFDAKLILKPDFFATVRGFSQFSDLVAEAVAGVRGVTYNRLDLRKLRPRIREVLFADTADFRLYNNAFILRRRTEYQDGFPLTDPEIVFKFRHADLATAAAVDVRPKIAGPYRIKFKAEALALKDGPGGYRMLYSHNCKFPLSSVHVGDRTNFKTLATIVPALSGLLGALEGKVELVNATLVEEVLVDLGTIDFGKQVAKANISLWRSLGDHKVMCGEFAFQTRFDSADAISAEVRSRAEELFVKLQYVATGWLLFGSTKTGLVYRMHGNAPQSNE